MEIGRIFSRSFELMWKFKFLLLFGLIMGLTAGSGSGGNGNFNMGDNSFSGGVEIAPAVIVLAAIVGVVFVMVLLALFFYFRFVARGALVAGVREIEAQGATTWREAWQAGRAFYTRLLGLGFVVNVPLALFSVIVILLAFLPLITMLATTGGRFTDSPEALLATLGVGGIFALCCAVLCLVVVNFVIHPLYELAVRAIVLEDLRVIEGIKRGIARARENLGNVVVLYLLLMGARIGWALVTAIVAIPVVIVFALAIFGVLRGDVNAAILFVLAAIVPLWLLFGALEGVFQTFESNVWTEAYLELLNKKQVA